MTYFKPQESIVSKTMGWSVWTVHFINENGKISTEPFKTKKEAFSFYAKKKYQENKENARQFAIEWQRETAKNALSWGEILEQQEKLKKIAKRYGLTKEFKENGII